MCWRKDSVNITVILCQCQCMWHILSSDIYSVATAISIPDLGDHIATSGCWSLSESFGSTFFELATVENSRFAVGISTPSIIVPDIYVLPVWAAILLFPVVGCCHSIWEHFFELAVVGKLHLWVHLQQYLFWIWFVILVNITTEFRQFKKLHTCLTSRLTTSGALNTTSRCFILYPLYTEEMSWKGGAICQIGIFLWFINFARVFLPPSSIR